MYIIGNLSIYLAAFLAVYSFIMYVVGIKKENQKFIDSAKGATIATFILASISMLLLFIALATSQFQFQLVAQYTSSDLPILYKLAGLWAGNAGSLMLWTFFLTMYSAIIIFSKKMINNPMTPYVVAIITLNTIFFYFVLAFHTNPFELVPGGITPIEGNGLNPMLQDPGMIIHPLAIYLGYVGLVVPFAFAIASLIVKNMDSFWIKMTRRWTIIAWVFLTLGNVIGGYWAYQELGWGGYWAWDPVENASLMPWFTVTAYLHSVMIQERKNMLKIWNISLIIISYALTLFGTFLVRSGVLTSVHAFAQSNIGSYFLIFMAFMVIFSMYILMSRYQLIKKDTGEIESIFSKESSFLINNLILVGATFAVFWGTVFPLVSEVVRGTKVTVGIPFFNTVMPPILLALMFVMAVCPLIAWQRSSLKNIVDNFLVPAILSLATVVIFVIFGMREAYPIIAILIIAFVVFTHIKEFITGTKARRKATNESVPLAFYRLVTKGRRRYGGYIVHLGIAIMGFGIIGQMYDVQKLQTVNLGETIEIQDYTLTYEGLYQVREGVNDIVFANLTIEKDGKDLGTIQPERIFYRNWPDPSTNVAINSTFKEDLYVVLSAWEADQRATFQIKVNPLVKWVWTGTYVVVIGALFAVWRGRTESVVPKYSGPQKKVH